MLRLSSEQDAAHKGSKTGGVPAGDTSQSHLQGLWQPCHSASRSSGNEPRGATVKADQQSFSVSGACVSRATDRLSPRSECLVLVSFIQERYHHPLHTDNYVATLGEFGPCASDIITRLALLLTTSPQSFPIVHQRITQSISIALMKVVGFQLVCGLHSYLCEAGDETCSQGYTVIMEVILLCRDQKPQ